MEPFEVFVDAHARRLLGSAYLLTGDRQAAQDLVQDALERVFVHWSRVQDPLAYTRTAMTRRATDGWRAVRRRPRQEPFDGTRHDTGVPEGTDRHADRAHVADLLRRLPPRQRAVVVLRFYEDRSEAQIAAVLDCSPGTVKSQAAKAMATLRRLVDERGGSGSSGTDDRTTGRRTT